MMWATGFSLNSVSLAAKAQGFQGNRTSSACKWIEDLGAIALGGSQLSSSLLSSLSLSLSLSLQELMGGGDQLAGRVHE